MSFREAIAAINLERSDVVEAVVVKNTSKGVIFAIDEGLTCFAPIGLPLYTKALITIRKIDFTTEYLLASVDTVTEYASLIA